MAVFFESGAPNRVLFKEKHVHTVETTITAGDLAAAVAKNTSLRTFVGKGSAVNSVLAMTVGHQQQLFAYLEKSRKNDLDKIKKASGMVVLDNIPVFGCVIVKDVARVKGTLKLGFIRSTNTKWAITHFGRHDWKGSSILKPETTLKV
jgi:hypothetical protein